MTQRFNKVVILIESYMKTKYDWVWNFDIAYRFNITPREVGTAMHRIGNVERMVTPEYHGKILYRYIHND